jgi:hypothetical protein
MNASMNTHEAATGAGHDVGVCRGTRVQIDIEETGKSPIRITKGVGCLGLKPYRLRPNGSGSRLIELSTSFQDGQQAFAQFMRQSCLQLRLCRSPS